MVHHPRAQWRCCVFVLWLLSSSSAMAQARQTAPKSVAPKTLTDTKADAVVQASPTAPKIKLAVTSLQGAGEVDAGMLAALSSVVAGRLDELGIFATITDRDIQQLVDYDALRSALSSDDVSQLASFGKALGAPFLVSGTVSKIGDSLVLALSLTDLAKVEVLRRETLKVPGGDSSLVRELRFRVDKLTLPLRRQRSGLIVVRTSEEGATIYVDDEVIGASPLPASSVPAGPHRVAAVKDGFVRTGTDTVVAAGATRSVELTMVPAKDFAATYRNTAWTFRIAALSVLAASALSALAGGSVWGAYLVREGQIAQETGQAEQGGPLKLRAAQYNELNSLRMTGGGLLALALPVAGAGLVVYALGDDPGRYDHLIQEDAE